MRISVKGRNVTVDDELRERVDKRFQKVARQVSEVAPLEVELREERNPKIKDSFIAEVTLHVKGKTLRAKAAAPNPITAINRSSDELARQVKRHRDMRRKRREAHRATPKLA